jgi:hypothetical protein
MSLVRVQPPLPCFGRVAQLVEQLTLNQRVLGSSPSAPTKIRMAGIPKESPWEGVPGALFLAHLLTSWRPPNLPGPGSVPSIGGGPIRFRLTSSIWNRPLQRLWRGRRFETARPCGAALGGRRGILGGRTGPARRGTVRARGPRLAPPGAIAFGTLRMHAHRGTLSGAETASGARSSAG